MNKKVFPLSSNQLSLYLAHQKSPTDTAFNIPVKMRLSHSVDITKLTDVINELARRHPMLTARILLNEMNEPENHLSPVTFSIQLISGEQDAASNTMRDLLTAPFDLAKERLIRFYLWHATPDESVFYIVHHHLIVDHLPLTFFRELQHLYALPTLPNETIPENIAYETFVKAERDYLQTEAAKNDRDYWQKIISTIEPIDLNLLPSTMQLDNLNRHVESVVIDRHHFENLKQTARHAGASPYALFTSALFMLLHQYTEQTHLTLGTVCNQRIYSGKADIVGDFSNIVLLSTNIQPVTIQQFIQSTWQSIITALKHGRYPYHELTKNQHASFQVAIVHHDMKKNAEINLQFDLCQLPNHPLMLEVIEESHQAILLFKYHASIFSRDHCRQMIKHYMTVLSAMVAAPDASTQTISLMNEEERQFLTQLSAPKNLTHPTHDSLSELFEHAAADYLNQTALVQAEKSVSYLELNERANQLARYIRQCHSAQFACDFPPDALVAIKCKRGIEAIIAMLAVLKAGGAYLPLDIAHPAERIAAILKDANVTIILTDQLPLNHNQSFLQIHLSEEAEKYQALSVANLGLPVAPTQLAYVIYTSGTTGKPNGVAIVHRGVCNLAIEQGRLFDITKGTRVLQFASLAFDASVSEIWCTLIHGGTLYFPANSAPLVGDAVSDFLNEHHIEVVTLSPSVLATVRPSAMMAPLKTLITAGESAHSLLLNAWMGKAKKILNAYGPTEGTVCATMHPYRLHDSPNNIGKPLPNVTVVILTQHLTLAPIGVTGEIYIGGVGVARGYLERPELTNTKFIKHSFYEEEERFYKTSDRGRYLPDGSIEYRGRRDNQIKIRGHRVELDEIENTLKKIHGVTQVAVLTETDGADTSLIAFIATHDDQFKIAGLSNQLAATLPIYMIPNHYHQVRDMPLTTSGKIDKKKLLSLIDNKPPVLASTDTPESNNSTDTPESNNHVFKKICADVLKINQEMVRMDASFLEQGGTSLSILKLLSKLKSTFHATLTIQALFEAKTLRDIETLATTKAIHVIHSQEDHVLADSRLIIKTPTPLTLCSQPPDSILLTGATGFLGINLLIQLLTLTKATIYCIVRSPSSESGYQKLEIAYRQYSTTAFHPDRIKIICGDISLPNLGLSDETRHDLAERIDSIYHCAAAVNHVYTYQMLRAANVQSTIELISFALQKKLKRIHYISTIDTVTSGDARFDSEAAPLPTCQVKWGYIQSKWVSEKILSQSDAPHVIYRPGNITGHSLSGVSDPSKNHALILLKSCIASRTAPDFKTQIEMTPVDILSAAIIHLSLDTELASRAYYNLHNPHSLTWREYLAIVQQAGHTINIVPVAKWQTDVLAKLDEQNPLAVFRQIYEGNEAEKLTLTPAMIPSTKTNAMLKKFNISHVQHHDSLVKMYLTFLSNTGFIEPPQPQSVTA